MDYRKEFIKEIDKIQNYDWKQKVLALVPKLPDYFWTSPASSSGKYHPVCDLGEGGVVRHSIMVERIALDLLEAEVLFKFDPVYRDLTIIASLFHDALKYGDNTKGRTVFDHPILAAEFLKENLDLGSEVTNMVLYNAVARHMGKWTTRPEEPNIVLEAPETAFEKMIHIADLISSKKYIGGLTEWGFITDTREENT